MDSRVEEIAEVTKMLPPPPLAIRKAINQGATEVKEAASQALEAKNKASPLSRFSSSTLDGLPFRVNQVANE